MPATTTTTTNTSATNTTVSSTSTNTSTSTSSTTKTQTLACSRLNCPDALGSWTGVQDVVSTLPLPGGVGGTVTYKFVPNLNCHVGDYDNRVKWLYSQWSEAGGGDPAGSGIAKCEQSVSGCQGDGCF